MFPPLTPTLISIEEPKTALFAIGDLSAKLTLVRGYRPDARAVLLSSGRILTKATPIVRHILSDLRNRTRTKLELEEPCLPNEATHGPGRVANRFGTLQLRLI